MMMQLWNTLYKVYTNKYLYYSHTIFHCRTKICLHSSDSRLYRLHTHWHLAQSYCVLPYARNVYLSNIQSTPTINFSIIGNTPTQPHTHAHTHTRTHTHTQDTHTYTHAHTHTTQTHTTCPLSALQTCAQINLVPSYTNLFVLYMCTIFSLLVIQAAR